MPYQNANPAVYRNADQRAADSTGLPPVRSSDAALLALMRVERNDFLDC